MTNVLSEPARYLVRPGQDDHRQLERLLTPGYWQKQPAELDGIVMDATFAHRMGEPLRSDPIRRAIVDRPIQILVDHQSYRLIDGHRRVVALDTLPYSRANLCDDDSRGFRSDDFKDSHLVNRFVQAVFDFQRGLSASDLVAPSFYLAKPASPWLDVNTALLKESINQYGTFVYATFCGSLSALEDQTCLAPIRENASGVYVLASPTTARHDSVTKLLRYVEALERLRSSGLCMIAGRQSAFGLVLMALGISGFDGGIARIESFDFSSLAREAKSDSTGGSHGGRSRPVYLSKLMTCIPRSAASKLLAIPGIKSQLNCPGLCCKDNMTDALQAAREHFVWSRLDEVKALRELSPVGQIRHIAEKLAGAHQMAKAVQRLLPTEQWDFEFLDNWSRVVEVVGARAVRGET